MSAKLHCHAAEQERDMRVAFERREPDGERRVMHVH
jgi:hypothetical protein